MEKIKYGWKCPSCNAVMAPWQSCCINCTGKNQKPIEYHTIAPSVTIQSNKVPNTITWANSLNNCTATDKTINCTLTAQDKLRTTLKSIGINT